MRLQVTVGSVACGDLVIVTGYMNARVGDDTDIRGEVLGTHGEDDCNENGKRLL